LMILQLRQIRLTDANTFMGDSLLFRKPLAYLERKTILARPRS